MGWSIAELVNNVYISDQCAKELYEANEAGKLSTEPPWYDLDSVRDGANLYFDIDHMEHMDYLWDEKIQEILNHHRVSGDVCFGSLEGDNAGNFWGYRFDGEGNMETLEGRIKWSPG